MESPVDMPSGGKIIARTLTGLRPSLIRHTTTARKPNRAARTDICKSVMDHILFMIPGTSFPHELVMSLELPSNRCLRTRHEPGNGSFLVA